MTRHLAMAITTIALFACTSKTAQDESREADFAAVGVRAASTPPVAVGGVAPMAKIQIANGEIDAVATSSQASVPDAKAVTVGTSQDVSPSMIIRTGQASIEVESLDPA